MTLKYIRRASAGLPRGSGPIEEFSSRMCGARVRARRGAWRRERAVIWQRGARGKQRGETEAAGISRSIGARVNAAVRKSKLDGKYRRRARIRGLTRAIGIVAATLERANEGRGPGEGN